MNRARGTAKLVRDLWARCGKYGRAALTFLAFFGITGTALLTCSEQIAQRALILAISPTLAAQSRADSVRTARMVRDTVRATVGPFRDEMAAGLNQIKTYLIRVPEVRRQVTAIERAKIQAERDSLDLQRAFPTFHPR